MVKNLNKSRKAFGYREWAQPRFNSNSEAKSKRKVTINFGLQKQKKHHRCSVIVGEAEASI